MKISTSSLLLLFLEIITLTPLASSSESYTLSDDASWAIYSTKLSKQLGEEKQGIYDEFIQGCQDAVDAKNKLKGNSCRIEEKFRLRMNREQPQSCYNYTDVGYKKIRAPKELFDLLSSFYEKNKGKDVVEWSTINTYHNMWSAPPTIMHLNQPKFQGGGPTLQAKVWEAAKDILEEWSGQHLSPVSLYGIRLYHNGSILTPHVDRFPLITSAIINIDQDVDEPWPLEVYNHEGIAENITMEPGDMVLYESHSVIHGRPFPLKGNYFANVFVHFEAVGPHDPTTASSYDPELDLPPYLIPGSPWEEDWKRNNPDGWRGSYMDGRQAARKGDVGALKRIAKVDPDSLSVADQNGWTPLHEAIRVGIRESVNIILLAGHDVDLQTNDGETPLDIAKKYLGVDHKVTKYLIALGAHDAAGLDAMKSEL